MGCGFKKRNYRAKKIKNLSIQDSLGCGFKKRNYPGKKIKNLSIQDNLGCGFKKRKYWGKKIKNLSIQGILDLCPTEQALDSLFPKQISDKLFIKMSFHAIFQAQNMFTPNIIPNQISMLQTTKLTWNIREIVMMTLTKVNLLLQFWSMKETYNLIFFSVRTNSISLMNTNCLMPLVKIQLLVFIHFEILKKIEWAMSWENLFMPHVNNKGADQPVCPHSLISTFVVHCLDSLIPLVSISEIPSLYLAPEAEQAGLSLPLSQTLKTGFLVMRLKYPWLACWFKVL